MPNARVVSTTPFRIRAAGPETILVDASRGPISVVLPLPAVGLPNDFWIQKIDLTLNIVTLSAEAGRLLNGSSSTLAVNVAFQGWRARTNGRDWFVHRIVS